MNEALALQTQQSIELANEGQRVRAACETVRAMPIPDQRARDALGAGLVEVKARRQELDAGKRSELEPHTSAVKTIRAKYAPAEDAYEALDGAMRERIARDASESAQARQAAQLAAGQAFQAGDNAAAYQALVAAPPPAETEGVGVHEAWAFEIVNEGLVPRAYCEPVPKLIRATFKPSQRDAPAPIPGVRFFRKSTVRVTG
jgi:hypothetical protein